jgi:hypothetical protein
MVLRVGPFGHADEMQQWNLSGMPFANSFSGKRLVAGDSASHERGLLTCLSCVQSFVLS